MSSELNRRVGVDVVVRGNTGSARLCLRIRRPPPSPPLSPSPPVPAPQVPPNPTVPAPAPPPPPVLVGIPPPLRRPTNAGTLMWNREFRDAADLRAGNRLSVRCGARNGVSGVPMGEVGDIGDDGTGEMLITPLYPLEGAANGVAELIEGDIGTSKMDEANVNAGGRCGCDEYCLPSTSFRSPSRSTEARIGERRTTRRRRFIRLRKHHSNKNIDNR